MSSPIKTIEVSGGQTLPIEKKGESMGNQRDKGGNGVNEQEKGEGLDQPISEKTKGAGIPKGEKSGIPKWVIQGHLMYVN